jgi:hypothetical protein
MLSDETYDAIDAFDKAHQHAVGLAALLTRDGHPFGEQLHEILDELLEQQAAIVDATTAIEAIPPASGRRASVLRLVPTARRDAN